MISTLKTGVTGEKSTFTEGRESTGERDGFKNQQV